jgi:anti-anti-sigma regulatory factor
MLRVTVQNDEKGATFKLEGKLAHEWVAEAEKAWLTLCEAPGQEPIAVDLCGISFVDDSGRDLLARMHATGAKLVGAGLMTSALIEEICSEARRSSRNWMRSLLSLLFLAQVGALAHRNDFFNLVRVLFPACLVYPIPAWFLSVQSFMSVFWKGLFQ